MSRLSLFIFLFLFHEFGHYIVAKHYGKFKKIVVVPILLTIGVQIIPPIPAKQYQFFALAGLLNTLPLGIGLSIVLNNIMWLIVVFALASLDILFFIFATIEARNNPFWHLTDKTTFILDFGFKEGR